MRASSMVWTKASSRDSDHRYRVSLTPDLVTFTVDKDLGIDPLADASDERTVRDQHGKLRGPPVFVAEFQGREFPFLLERGLVANEAWSFGAVTIAQKLVVLSQDPCDVQLAVAWGVAGVGDFDGRVSDRLGGAGHRHVVGKEQVPVAVEDRLGDLGGSSSGIPPSTLFC